MRMQVEEVRRGLRKGEREESTAGSKARQLGFLEVEEASVVAM